MKAKLALCLMIAAMAWGQSLAVEPDEILDDPALEARAREISRTLRCVTCQSQSIDDSDAMLAKDLRLVVRERLLAGDSNEDVISYMTARYGGYVRLKPAMNAGTALLWLTPLITLGAACGAAFFYFRGLQQGEETSSGDDDNDTADV